MDPNYLDLKPKLSELQKFLIPAACEKREAIGIALGLADDDDGEFLEELDKKHTSEKYLLEVLKRWLRACASTDVKPATWKSMLEVLESQDLNDVAKKIKSHFCEDAMPLNQSIPEALPLEQPVNMDNLDQPEPMILQRDYSVHMKEGCKIRSYQEELAAPGIKGENYIIIAPTGSGKTLVAARVISSHLQKNQDQEQPCHGIFVVNTKPLAEQQKDELKSFLPAARVEVYTGDNPGTLAESIKHNNDISVCTAGKFLDEVKKGLVKFNQLSLIVFDECHHTRKGHPYARLMEHFLEFKEKQGQSAVLPQIFGMTASPGAGENENLDRTKTIEHLKRLAALMNAHGGFKTVTENIAELQESTKNSSYTYKILRPRDHKNDSFIDLITAEMKALERCVPEIKISVQRWAQEYETIVQQNKLKYEFSSDEGARDHISTLNALRRYSNALYIYMDLRQEDAIKEIQDYASDGFPADDVNATPHESNIKSRMLSLLNKHLPPKPNPMLENMAKILRDNFEVEPTSRAILFVRTKKHVHSIKDWVCSHKILRSVKPDVITGHTRETGSGMTQVEQEAVMDRFRKGSSNLLIATSVAEEGLDVPKCNLVIRYHHVSNEIALVQTEGRARAENSQGITILPCDSRKMLRELKNKELVALVDDILEKQHIPSGRHLEKELTCIQKEIVIRRRRKAALRLKRRRSHTADEVRLLCKKCKVFACSGSDVHTIEAGESGHHYVVPAMDSDTYTTKPHPKPRDIVLDTVKKTQKVFCKCGHDWGIMCIWPAKGDSYPVIKCSAFIFIIKGDKHSFKKWGDVPFTMETLDDYWLKKDASSDTDSSD